jgi:hypothetical protein
LIFKLFKPMIYFFYPIDSGVGVGVEVFVGVIDGVGVGVDVGDGIQEEQPFRLE